MQVSAGKWAAICYWSGSQPFWPVWHRNVMLTRSLAFALFALVLGSFAACSPNQSPDEIRQKTAEETSAIKRDSKAVAEGIKQGLSNKKTIDLNKASKEEISSLPGVNAHTADRIIAERPYATTHQLVSRHVVSEDEFSQIQDQVTVTH